MSVMKMFDLTGKVAVITGAGNGLGYQFAEAMAEAGADVVCADIDLARNDATAARVEALGRKALSIKWDVTRESDVAGLFQSAEKTFAHVDIAFANAGIADLAPQPLHDYPTDNEFTPMGRVADASESKGTALCLASNASSFKAGLMLVTDGGCMAK